MAQDGRRHRSEPDEVAQRVSAIVRKARAILPRDAIRRLEAQGVKPRTAARWVASFKLIVETDAKQKRLTILLPDGRLAAADYSELEDEIRPELLEIMRSHEKRWGSLRDFFGSGKASDDSTLRLVAMRLERSPEELKPDYYRVLGSLYKDLVEGRISGVEEVVYEYG